MKLQELVTLLSNKVASLNVARSTAIGLGDVESVLRLDSEITETQATLDTLQSVS